MKIDRPESEMTGAYSVLIIVILMAFNGLSTLLGWFHSVDVKGWWPVLFIVQFLIAFTYTVAFVLIMKHSSMMCRKFIILYNSILGLILLLHSYLYYTAKVNWLAVNAGVAKLDFVQTIIFNDSTPYVIYASFLLGAWIASRVKRNRDTCKEMSNKKS